MSIRSFVTLFPVALAPVLGCASQAADDAAPASAAFSSADFRAEVLAAAPLRSLAYELAFGGSGSGSGSGNGEKSSRLGPGASVSPPPPVPCVIDEGGLFRGPSVVCGSLELAPGNDASGFFLAGSDGTTFRSDAIYDQLNPPPAPCSESDTVTACSFTCCGRHSCPPSCESDCVLSCTQACTANAWDGFASDLLSRQIRCGRH